jgi:hypothetical protein
MTTPGKHTDADITADRGPASASYGPTPYHLGLTVNPDLSWDDINIAQPTPFDLNWVYDPELSWEEFVERLPENRRQTPDQNLALEATESQDPEAGV